MPELDPTIVDALDVVYGRMPQLMPQEGWRRGVGLAVRGATGGLAGADVPPRDMTERIIEILGEIPTVTGVSLLASPMTAAALRATGAGLRAAAVGGRVGAAGLAGGALGGTRAATEGAPLGEVAERAAEEAALFGLGEAAWVGGAAALRRLRSAAKEGARTVPEMPETPALPSGAVPGQKALPQGPIVAGPGPEPLQYPRLPAGSIAMPERMVPPEPVQAPLPMQEPLHFPRVQPSQPAIPLPERMPTASPLVETLSKIEDPAIRSQVMSSMFRIEPDGTLVPINGEVQAAIDRLSQFSRAIQQELPMGPGQLELFPEGQRAGLGGRLTPFETAPPRPAAPVPAGREVPTQPGAPKVPEPLVRDPQTGLHITQKQLEVLARRRDGRLAVAETREPMKPENILRQPPAVATETVNASLNNPPKLADLVAITGSSEAVLTKRLVAQTGIPEAEVRTFLATLPPPGGNVPITSRIDMENLKRELDQLRGAMSKAGTPDEISRIASRQVAIEGQIKQGRKSANEVRQDMILKWLQERCR